MSARRAGAAVFGAIVGAWIGRAAFKWILGVPDGWQLPLIAVTALVGAIVCATAESEARAG
jgi:hypothetical protein